MSLSLTEEFGQVEKLTFASVQDESLALCQSFRVA
jgi:hypothetical protein